MYFGRFKKKTRNNHLTNPSMSKTPTLNPITSEQELETWISKEQMLLIIDIHLEWTGPCEAHIPFLDQLRVSFDFVDKRLAFLAVEVPKYAEILEKGLSLSPACILPSFIQEDTATSEKIKLLTQKKGCSPLFIAVKGKKIIAIVDAGANYPAIEKIVYDHIPKLSEEEQEEVEEEEQDGEDQEDDGKGRDDVNSRNETEEH